MACLGSGLYHAQIRVIGTGALVEEIAENEILSGTWNRLTNRTSKATLSLPLTGTLEDKCCRFLDLGKGIPAYELYLWRDVPGVDPALVWKGPLTDLEVQPGNVVNLVAQDMSWWLTKRFIGTQSYVGQDVNYIAYQMATYGYGLNNPAGVVVTYENSGIIGEKTPSQEDGSKVLPQITDVIRGVSYWTCVLNDFRIGANCSIPWTFTDDDIAEAPPLSWSADNYSTEMFARTSNTNFGSAGGIDSTRFGFPILVQDVIDANAGNVTDANAFAVKSLAEHNTTGPVLGALNSAIVPSVELDIMSLIPGCKVKVNFEQYCENIVRELYLTQCEVAWNPEDEDIRIELSPTWGDSEDARVAAV